MYETTSELLDDFGLATIDDLPDIQQFITEEKVDKDSDLYTSTYKDGGEE